VVAGDYSRAVETHGLTLTTPVLVHNRSTNGEPTSRGPTGRTTAGGANEQQAMDLVRDNEQYGNRLPVCMNDPRWPADDGRVKMVYNTRTGVADDLKFNDWSE
jgi:hypothetical protein